MDIVRPTLNYIHLSVVTSISRIGTYTDSKNNRQGISWRYTEYKLNAYYY